MCQEKEGVITHHHVILMSMWCWVISPFYDFCSFWCVDVNTMDKLPFLAFIFAVLLSVTVHFITVRRYAKCSICRCRGLCVCVCLSLCLCVTLRYCIKVAKRSITQIMPHDSPRTSFLTPKFTAKFEWYHGIGVENKAFVLTKPVAVNTGLHNCATCDQICCWHK